MIGIDPAASKPSAMAIIENERCCLYANVDSRINNWIAYIEIMKPDLIAIEGQYGGPNIKTLIQLAEARGRLVAACEYCNIDHEIVQPQQWMNSIGLYSKTKKSLARDAWILKLAKQILKEDAGDDLNIDHAAAIHIGFYSYRRFKFRKSINKPI